MSSNCQSSWQGQSDNYIDANIQLALALIKRLNTAKGLTVRLVSLHDDMPSGHDSWHAQK